MRLEKGAKGYPKRPGQPSLKSFFRVPPINRPQGTGGFHLVYYKNGTLSTANGRETKNQRTRLAKLPRA